MGIKQSELTPTVVTPLTPPGHRPAAKVVQVLRTESGTVQKAILPASASVAEVLFHGSVASDATTSASLAITLLQGGVTFSSGTVDVKTSGTVTAIVQMTNLPNVQQAPSTGDIIVNMAKTTSGAETVGGPWKLTLRYLE